jgi:hypothetical protein
LALPFEVCRVADESRENRRGNPLIMSVEPCASVEPASRIRDLEGDVKRDAGNG